MKQILVTGGAGYIGSHTVVELVKNGYEPVILDNFSNSNPSTLENVFDLCGKEITVIEGDCCDLGLLNSIFASHQFEGVIHFAAFKAVGESVTEPLAYYHNNLESLMAVLHTMENHHVSKFVFSSSCTVYGMPVGETKVYEHTPLGTPNSPYGWTKFMGEQIIRDCAKGGKIKPVLLRYFNPIGAHESGKIGELPVGIPNNIVPYMTQTAAGIREQLTVFGSDYSTLDGTCIRDFIHVTDLANAHIKALEVAVVDEPAVFNVGTGKGTSVLELIEAFEKAIHKKLNWQFGPRREGDVVEIYADVTKATSELNWKATKNVSEAVADAWKWEQYRLENEIH